MKLLDTGARVYLNNDAIFREHEISKSSKQTAGAAATDHHVINLHDGTTMNVGDTHLTIFTVGGRVVECRPYLGAEKQLIHALLPLLALNKRTEGIGK